MSFISELSNVFKPVWPEFKESVRVRIDSEPSAPEKVVADLAAIEGAVDVYCWYEGARSLPESGALFMKRELFEPLYQFKSDAKLCLYSLRAWSFAKSVSKMAVSTPIGDAINRINTAAIESISSSSFFKYCANTSKEDPLYLFINEELPKKQWLLELSAAQKKSGRSVASLFDDRVSLFDCIKKLDVTAAYSAMQYVEGYYLIQESVRKGLLKREKKIQIAFVLPNNESKYYLDLPKDIGKMLELAFGKELNGVEVTISFQFFLYGETMDARPYIDKKSEASKVEAKTVCSYFDYLSQQSSFASNAKRVEIRDDE
ncbi:hypothetical protein PNK_1806 [Candidatus Protochlamydia naegleriophila]|uniref:Uncharacterized protein n=1 Tax=Candidatus Protochlamydia naegleriophila TaxID=389348 RepID=A0A0U5JHG6_9BACT|nr:hypothetical protein [Candidatus Protochlamydia naegleriophila]CUI17413.1 hypothetical protein PNK_1806 [Candidatus Protochlamydia naegleriophila]